MLFWGGGLTPQRGGDSAGFCSCPVSNLSPRGGPSSILRLLFARVFASLRVLPRAQRLTNLGSSKASLQVFAPSPLTPFSSSLQFSAPPFVWAHISSFGPHCTVQNIAAASLELLRIVHPLARRTAGPRDTSL
mmetsp:Transcript_3768/g.10465  ORF Transcript_3768/g.10465 Transcript_3768/m.10465 type:complete len:133 (-) Transcript_3768:1733-2131(-)